MAEPTWSELATARITDVYLRESAAGASRQAIVKAINEAYPFGERARYPYRCWLSARREFLIAHGLSDQPGAGLRNRLPSLPPGQKQLPLFARHPSSGA